MRSREAAAEQAEEIIESQVAHFMGWMRSLEAINMIRNYRAAADATREELLDKAMRQLANGKEPTEVLTELAHTLTNKLIHQPTAQMNQAAYAGNQELLAVAQQLLGIEKEDN